MGRCQPVHSRYVESSACPDPKKIVDSDRAELVLERLTEESQRDVEHIFKGLRSTFAQATANSSETGELAHKTHEKSLIYHSHLDLGLDEASFTTLVIQKIALPSPILQGVGPILFDMLSYTSSLPFPSPTTPTHLNLDALILGVAILTPDLNPLSKGDESSNYVVSRRRTEQDARRIVFQALAARGSHIEDMPSTPKAGDATSRSSEQFFIDVSAEDPQTTDLLDALVVSQPEQTPYTSNVARSFFKGVAATLLTAQTQQRETLYSQQVSKERFRAVLKLTLAFQAMKSVSTPVIVAEVEREAGRLVEEIFAQPEAESVGWKRFNDRVEKSIVSVMIPALPIFLDGIC